MVDDSAQLLIITSKDYWKVVVERCACYLYLGKYSIMRVLSHEKGAKEWESNLKSFLRVLSISRIFDFDGLFYWMILVTGGHSHFNNQKSCLQGACDVECGKSAADIVEVEVFPSTASIL